MHLRNQSAVYIDKEILYDGGTNCGKVEQPCRSQKTERPVPAGGGGGAGRLTPGRFALGDGAAAPSTENLVELARLYGVTLYALVNGPAPAAASTAGEAPRRKIQWGWITAAALALILAAVIAAWALHDGGERDSEIIKEEDMQEEVIDIGSVDALPWEEE